MPNVYIVYVTGALYNLCLALLYILIPLRALDLGLSGLEIGLVFSLPVIVTLVAGLAGGILNDRWGEKVIILFSYVSMVFGALVFAFADSFHTLLLAQAVLALSRAVFWTPTQAYLSRVSSAGLGRRLGLFASINNAGAIVGSVVAGYLSILVGFATSFLIVAVLASLPALMAVRLQSLPRPGVERSLAQVIGAFPRLMKTRAMYLSGLCAFFAAMPIVLMGSFYPVYMDSVAISAGAIGVVIAFRSVGSLVCSALVGRILDRIPSHWPAYGVAFLAYGAAIGLTPLFTDPVPLAMVAFAAGVGSGVLNVIYQVVATEHSQERDRGSAMALTGEFWVASHLAFPLAYGLAMEADALATAFVVTGLISLLAAALARPTYTWLAGPPRRYAPRHLSH